MGIKLCVEADSFRTEEKDFAYSVKMAQELGFKYIEPEMMTGRCLLNIYGYCNITSLENDPMEMRKLIESHGLKVPCLSTHSNLFNTEYGVDYLKKAIRFAYILGAPIVNTAEGPKPEWMTDDDAFRIMGYNLKTILEMAENYDITITIEPHGVYTTNAEGLLRIMDLSDSEYLAINFDTGNVTIAGNDSYETLKAVIDHVVHVHLKDVKRQGSSNETTRLRRGEACAFRTPHRPMETTEETGVVAGVAVGDGDVDIKRCLDPLIP